MGIPYLNSDESILLSTHNILVDAAVSEAILTNRRLLIIDSSAQPRHKDIPFAAIETVTTMESGSGDPAISLAIRAKSGGTKPMQVVFSPMPRSQRLSERDDWAQKVKDQIALLPEGTAPETVDFEEDETVDLKKLIGYKPDGTPIEPEDKNVPASSGPRSKTALSSRFHPPASASSNKTMVIVSAVVIVILLAVAAVFVYPMLMPSATTVPPTPVPTQVPTMVPTPEITAVQTAAETPTFAETAQPTPLPTGTPIPQVTTVTTTQSQVSSASTGIWVRVISDTTYTGTIGTAGRMQVISGTGEKYFQIPARPTDILDISIQKQDTSGTALTVEIFNNGVMINNKTITKPKGTLEMNLDLKITQTAVVTPVVTS